MKKPLTLLSEADKDRKMIVKYIKDINQEANAHI
jgi:hypothetical protein